MTREPNQLNHYKSPHAFRSAFERRYRDDPRRALVLIMQRFVARVCSFVDGAVLKGGLGLELRLDTPRTTKDADIIIAGSHDLDARLDEAGRIDLGDFLKFSVVAERGGSTFTVPGMAYHARRYRVQAYFTDRDLPQVRAQGQDPYRSFTLEISIREPAGFDIMTSRLESFPQAEVREIRVYSLSWQIAEKVHAYTDPRHRETTNRDMMRPRDLLDLCRCAVAITTHAKLESSGLRNALTQTFERRKQAAERQGIRLPDLPSQLPPLPAAWEQLFIEQVAQASLPWTTPTAAHAVAAGLIDPVLDGTATGIWQPAMKAWI